MDSNEFVRCGTQMLYYAQEYHTSLGQRPVLPDVKPGFLRELMPDHAPEDGETFDAIMQDVERLIMPGITHWQSPNFFAFYPGNTSYPGILADMLSGATAGVGFSWLANPSMTELEIITMDWLGKMLGLPESFLFRTSDGKETSGGGVIQGTASEALCVMLLSARQRALRQMKAEKPDAGDHELFGKMVAYASDQVHFSFQKAGIITTVKTRTVPSDHNCSLRGEALAKAMQEDRDKGLVPIFVCATLGTTSTCAFDNVEEIASACGDSGVWLHIDAAYAGSTFICPEYRYWMKGVEMADSFNFNPHKNLLVPFDCSALWVKCQKDLVGAFNVSADIMDNPFSASGLVTDYRHWQIPLGRRFRSLKLWFVMRSYGVHGLQKVIRERIRHGTVFADLLQQDDRFEMSAPQHLGLVCFRLKGDNDLNQSLLDRIHASRQIFLSSTTVRDVFMLRMAAGSLFTEEKDVRRAWDIIQQNATQLLSA